MPIVHINSFRTSVKAVWDWDDTDDEGLVAFMTAGRSILTNNFTVERFEGVTRLQWQEYQYWDGGYIPTGVYDYIPIVAGDHLDPTCPYPYPTPAKPGARDLVGMWVSDQYGRPLDINDMQAS